MSRLNVRRSRAARGAGVMCALVLGILALPLAPAAAHDELISTEPAPEAVLAASPQEIALEFSADLLNISPTIVLTGPTGTVALGEPAVDGTRIAAAVPAELPAGPYTVAWRVVSGDGHPIQGSFAFKVDAPAGEPGQDPDPTPSPPSSDDPSTATTVPDPAPSPAPTSSPDSALTGGTTGGVTAGAAAAVGVAALAAIGALVAVLARRRR